MQAGLDRPPGLGHVAEDEDHPSTSPCSPRIGAALSSMGRSVPSLATRTVWFASPTMTPSRRTLATGFSTGRRVCSWMMGKTVPRLPLASAALQPVRAGDRVEEVTRPCGSVTMTASPMLARVIRSRSRSWCRSGRPPPDLFLHPALACRSRSSACRRSVRSRVTLAKPRSVPASSRRAVMTTLAQKREPSLRTRQPSSSNRPSAGASRSSSSGQPRSTASWRVEAGEVLADDLVGAVALDAARPRRSRWRPALGVEHEDGVVLHALDQQAESLLALPQLLLGLLPLGQVAGDLDEAPRLPPSSRRAVMTTLAQNREPSLRTRQPSSS